MLIFITGGSKQGKTTLAHKLANKFKCNVISTDNLYHSRTKKMLLWSDIGKDLPIKKTFYKKGIIEGTALYCEKERALIEDIVGEKGKLILLDSEAGWKRCWNKNQSLWKKQGRTKENMIEHFNNAKARYEGVRQEVAKGNATKWEDK